ncbi:MAG TPA: TIGR01212 family radical SAM protein [Spirochaetales bacterium]|jgi:radical SAM protein (TIGR01212 family)|nr:TIGR01212 family radical SAM protein [Spirochaetales bacterium]
MRKHWRGYAQYLESVYSKRVYRIGLDAGFSCPNRDEGRAGGCAFCDGTGASAMYQRSGESSFTHASPFDEELSKTAPIAVLSLEQRCSSLKDQIERGRSFLKRRYKAELFSAYFQAWTNTYADVATLKALYDAALDEGPFTELIISTRPDCITDEVLNLLKGYKSRVSKVWVELGLQSSNPQTLKRIGRGHDADCYILSAKALHSRGIGVCTHIVVGLPGETQGDFKQTCLWINKAESEAVKIHNLHVCGGTRLYDWYAQGEVSVPSLRRHVENSIWILRHLKKDIVVERLICETPNHRLVAPRTFPDKSAFLSLLEKTMEERDVWQGDLT